MATGKRLRYDGVETYLDLNLGSGETVIQFTKELECDGGTDINTLNAGEYISLSILDANYVLYEIVHLVSYTAGAKTGTVERGQEGTTARDHLKGQKVVHAPTSDDFFDVQTHLDDPNAHQSYIQSTVDAAVNTAMQNHKNPAVEPDPHTQYMRDDQPITFPPYNITVPSGGNIIVNEGGKITINQGGELIVEGDLIIRNTGRLFINGKQLYIGNIEPTNATANMVWLKTFG